MSDVELMSCHQLSWQIGERALLNDIDLTFHAGELVAIIGPNGAGKSSLLRALMGLQQGVTGQVELNGQVLASVAMSERAKQVAYMAQQSSVVWPLTVKHTVALGRLPHQGFRRRLSDEDRTVIDHAMQQADVAHLSERTIDTLSGGELSRVMIARLFAGQAPLILADEPIAALDPYHQLHVMELLQAHCRREGAALVVMHDLAMAARFCDRVVVMQKGRVVVNGHPREVLSDDLLARVYGVQVKRCEGEIIPLARID